MTNQPTYTLTDTRTGEAPAELLTDIAVNGDYLTSQTRDQLRRLIRVTRHS